MYADTTIIIPTLNEGGNIKELISRLIKEYPTIRIIVPDDGSIDKTQEIVKLFYNQGVKFLDRKNKTIHGLSESVMDACMHTYTENIIVIDADFQHPIEKIREIVTLLETNEIIICARKSLPIKWPISRKIISLSAQILMRARLLNKFDRLFDPSSGYFGIKTRVFRHIIQLYKKRIDGRGYKILFDILKYSNKNVKISYVFYDFGLRKKGHSKISKKHIYYFIKSLFR